MSDEPHYSAEQMRQANEAAKVRLGKTDHTGRAVEVADLLREIDYLTHQRDDVIVPRLRYWQGVSWRLAHALQHISSLSDDDHAVGHARAALAENDLPINYPRDQMTVGARRRLDTINREVQ